MKKSFCKQNCVRGKTLTQDLEALTSNSGSTYMTLGTSLNQSINQSLSLSLSFSFSCKVKALDQISGFQTKFYGVNLEELCR